MIPSPVLNSDIQSLVNGGLYINFLLITSSLKLGQSKYTDQFDELCIFTVIIVWTKNWYSTTFPLNFYMVPRSCSHLTIHGNVYIYTAPRYNQIKNSSMKFFTNFSSGLEHCQIVFIALALARRLTHFIAVSQKIPIQNII